MKDLVGGGSVCRKISDDGGLVVVIVVIVLSSQMAGVGQDGESTPQEHQEDGEGQVAVDDVAIVVAMEFLAKG